MRTESPGARVTCSVVGAGLWAWALPEPSEAAVITRKGSRNERGINLTGYRKVGVVRHLSEQYGPERKTSVPRAHELCPGRSPRPRRRMVTQAKAM